MKRKIIAMAAVISTVLAIVGCGSEKPNEIVAEESQSEQISTEIQAISDISESATDGMWKNSYVDIQGKNGKYQTRIYLDSVDASRAECIYFVANVAMNVMERDVESDFYVVTYGEEYELNMDGKEFADIGFPKEWTEDFEGGDNDLKILNQNVSIDFKNSLESWSKYSFKRYLDEVFKEDGLEKQEIKTEIGEVETEEKENNFETLAQKTYSIMEDTFDFSLRQKEDGEYSFTLLCNIEDKSDAYMTHICLNALFNSDEEELKALTETMNFSYSIFVGDGTLILRTKGLLYLTKDGESIDVNDYFSVDWILSDERKDSDYGTQVTEFLVDFMENE